MLVALTLLPLAAAKKPENANYAGVAIGYDGRFQSANDVKTTYNNFSIQLEGANFFGKNQYFGVGYSGAFVIPCSVKVGDVSQSSDNAKTRFYFGAAALGRYPVNDKIAVIGGIGLDFNFRNISPSTTALSITTKIDGFTLEMYGDLKAVYSIKDNIGIYAGLRMGGPLVVNYTTKTTISGSTTSTTAKQDISYFHIRPYIGAAFMY